MRTPPALSSRLAATAVVVAGLLVAAGAPAESAGTFCPADSGITTFRWNGGAANGQWVDGNNWNRGVAPGFDGTDTNVRVCLPATADVELVHNDAATHGEAIVDVLDMQAGSRLTITDSGRLFLTGDPAALTSVVRRSSAAPAVLTLSGTLGGRGALQVDGRLDWTKTPAGGTTMTTRGCQVVRTCAAGSEPRTPGETRIGAQGVLNVDGGGTNLIDDRVISSAGTVSISDGSYVAADNGTGIDIRSAVGSVLKMAGQASIYQGFADDPGRARIVLAGKVLKTGTGTSTLDANVVVRPTARSQVSGGWLSLGGGLTPVATVEPGSTLGVGRCDGANSNCVEPVSSKADPGTLSVELPGLAGAPGADVTLAEIPDAQAAKDLVAPVDIHVAGDTSTAADPMRFRFRLDQTAVGTRTPRSIQVFRKPSGSPMVQIADCRPDGTPPPGPRACVASRTPLPDGDVRVVVNSQVNSRWKIR